MIVKCKCGNEFDNREGCICPQCKDKQDNVYLDDDEYEKNKRQHEMKVFKRRMIIAGAFSLFSIILAIVAIIIL